MRMVKIPNCSYELFCAIRLEILKKVPLALINSEYLGEEKLGFFYFGDTDYIPIEMKEFIVKPPHEPKFDFSLIEFERG